MVILIAIAYTDLDSVSRNAARSIIESNMGDFEDFSGHMRLGDIVLFRSDVPLLEAEYIDDFGFESVLFISKHRSEKGVVSFTAHALGNWNEKCELGGRPFSLCVCEPVGMLEALRSMNGMERGDAQVVYEATHHGPLLKTPSCFIEFGGPQDVLGNKAYADLLGRAVLETAIKLSDKEAEFDKVVVGIGGMHYPEKFSSLALDRGYAFSHIMPKYAIINNADVKNLEMLEKAVEASRIKPDGAVLDWKSLNSAARAMITKKLNELGLDYEKV